MSRDLITQLRGHLQAAWRLNQSIRVQSGKRNHAVESMAIDVEKQLNRALETADALSPAAGGEQMTSTEIGAFVADYMASHMEMLDTERDQQQNWIFGHMVTLIHRLLDRDEAAEGRGTPIAPAWQGNANHQLTDRDVDEFLSEPQKNDPERLERIREQFDALKAKADKQERLETWA